MGKILIVDDSATVRLWVRKSVETLGHEAFEAEDGMEAFERLCQHCDVDLLVVDIVMPRMDGLELLEKLKKQGVTVPSIVMTTNSPHEEMARARAAGARGWLVKPLRHEALKVVIERLGLPTSTQPPA